MMTRDQQQKRKAFHTCQCSSCQCHPYGGLAKQHHAINRVLVTLNEKHRRRFAGLLALERGRGGIQAVATITGLSRNTIRRGREEVRRTDRLNTVRHAGAGRQAVEKKARTF
jgi:hypothetical protein